MLLKLFWWENRKSIIFWLISQELAGKREVGSFEAVIGKSVDNCEWDVGRFDAAYQELIHIARADIGGECLGIRVLAQPPGMVVARIVGANADGNAGKLFSVSKVGSDIFRKAFADAIHIHGPRRRIGMRLDIGCVAEHYLSAAGENDPVTALVSGGSQNIISTLNIVGEQRRSEISIRTGIGGQVNDGFNVLASLLAGFKVAYVQLDDLVSLLGVIWKVSLYPVGQAKYIPLSCVLEKSRAYATSGSREQDPTPGRRWQIFFLRIVLFRVRHRVFPPYSAVYLLSIISCFARMFPGCCRT